MLGDMTDTLKQSRDEAEKSLEWCHTVFAPDYHPVRIQAQTILKLCKALEKADQCYKDGASYKFFTIEVLQILAGDANE